MFQFLKICSCKLFITITLACVNISTCLIVNIIILDSSCILIYINIYYTFAFCISPNNYTLRGLHFENKNNYVDLLNLVLFFLF